MQSLEKQVKNRFNISDLIKKLLNRVLKLEQGGGSGGGGVTLPIGIPDVTNLQPSLNNKQDTLVSGTNIKTVNGNTLLGLGNLVIGGASAITTTYANLVTLISSNSLTIGQSYLVTDYQTRHRIDGTANLNDNNVNEPLMVVASATNNIFSQVYSPSNRFDIIFWDYANNLCEDGVTARTGKITRRIDTVKNIDTYWDFRKVQVERIGVKYLSIPADAKNIVVGKCEISGFNYNNLKLGDSCFSITFGYYCHSNTFGNYCNSISFGYYCTSNILGDSCSSISFGYNCYSNTFGTDCSSISFGAGCSSMTFGNFCYSMTFGTGCNLITFGNFCSSNTFGASCSSNTFGGGCTSSTLGNNCSSNTFGNYCNSNTFGDDCTSNILGSDCTSNTFGDYCNSNTFGNNCGLNNFGNQVINKNFTNVNPFNLSILVSTNSSQTFTTQANVQNLVYDMKSPDLSLWANKIDNAGVVTRIKLV